MLRKERKRTQCANSLLPLDVTNRVIELTTRVLSSSTEFKFKYCLEQFLTKFVGPETDPAIVTRQRAINKFYATERNNEATNERLLITSDDYPLLDRIVDQHSRIIRPAVTYKEFMVRAAMFVEQVIGSVPLEEVLDGAFSGGATTSHRRRHGFPAMKFQDKADTTPSCWDVVRDYISDVPNWNHQLNEVHGGPNFVDGSVLFTVPKNTEIDRCAATEPDLNMYFQKGVGSFIRKRLKEHGNDLNDQSINGNLARIGSIDSSLFTLDLSSASDSISKELVFQLLPICWYTHLDAIRSHSTKIDSENHLLEMFSSMGNGFTFELESLLFWSIARSVAYFRGVRGTISVYGDDIIGPHAIYDDLIKVLSYLGFETNVSKSFNSTPFRESCGKHWYAGIAVTPFYIRRPISRYTDLIQYLNALRRWADQENIGICDPRIDDLWITFASYIPSMYHGGDDTNSNQSLVTHHGARYRLVPITRNRMHTDTGGYLFWLRQGYLRNHTSAIETSFESIDQGRMRKRRAASAVTRNKPLLLSEL